MKNSIWWIPLLLLTIPGFGQKKKKTLFIIADGISADVVERLNPPRLRSIVADGAYLRMYQGGEKGTYSETPTVSAPGYNNILTGVWVNKHNVNNNQIRQPN